MAQFVKEATCLDYLKERKNSDVWTFPYIKELKVLGFDVPPMLKETVPDQIENYVDTPGVLDEVLDSHGLFLSLPNEDGTKYQTLGLAETSLQSLYDRAGFSGSRTVALWERKGKRACAQADERAKLLSFGLSLDDAGAKVLIRDGKIATVRSEQYAIIPEYDLVSAMSVALKRDYESCSFLLSTISYDLTVVDYKAENRVTLQNLNKILAADSCSMGFTLVTSDTGTSSVSVYPYIVYTKDGRRHEMPLHPTSFKHEGKADVETFKESLDHAGNIGRMMEEIERLASVELSHPADVFRNVCCELKLSKDASMKEAEEFDALYPTRCTGADVYGWLFNLAPDSIEGEIRHMDRCMRVLSMDLKKKDYVFEWSE